MNSSSLAGHVLEMLELADRLASPADVLVADFVRQRKYLGSHDRRFITDKFYLILRHRRYLDTLVDRYLAEPGHEQMLPTQNDRYLPIYVAAMHLVEERPVEEILLSARSRWETVFPKFALEAFLSYCTTHSTLEFITYERERLAIRTSFPTWMVERFENEYGDETESLLNALNTPARTVLRVNTLRCTRQACLDRLIEEGVEAELTAISSVGLVVKKRFNRNSLASFNDGWFEVQDEGSQIVGMLLPIVKGMTVIDACAGAGGKALHIADRMNDEGEVIAFDINEKRLEELQLRGDRAGLRSIKVLPEGTYQPENFYRSADLVLVDAPCSGSGTIRRNPAMKSSITESLVKHYHEMQLKILENAERYVKPGGMLVYVTCSLFREENQRSVQEFMNDRRGYSHAPIAANYINITENADQSISFLPHKIDADGFYVAVMKKS